MKLTQEMNLAFQDLLSSVDALPSAQRLLSGTSSKAEYLGYLCQTYHYVSWTVPLLRRAAQRMLELGQDSEFAELLALKASQEKSHEYWVLADAHALGSSHEAVIATRPCPAVKLYIAWNQFIVEGTTPVAFLGTAYALERLSIERGAVAVSQLRLHSSIPGIHRALTFLEQHATEDVSHSDLLVEELEGLRSPHERELAVESVRMTGRVYAGILESIADDADIGRTGNLEP